jgi:hypothetical protein
MKRIYLTIVLFFTIPILNASIQMCHCTKEVTIWNWQSPYPVGTVITYEWTYVVTPQVGCSQGLSTLNMYNFGDVSVYSGGFLVDFQIFITGIQSAINCDRGTTA